MGAADPGDGVEGRDPGQDRLRQEGVVAHAELGYAPERRRWLRRAALLHDVGKLGVSNAILDNAKARAMSSR
jgi:response regulator RpfG family c-di-GMP phosphodiesterase